MRYAITCCGTLPFAGNSCYVIPTVTIVEYASIRDETTATTPLHLRPEPRLVRIGEGSDREELIPAPYLLNTTPLLC